MDKKLARMIGSVARTLRHEAELTQADVAERLGIAVEVYGRMERGIILPRVSTLRKMAAVLRASTDHLLGIDEGESHPRPDPADRLMPELRRLLRRAERLDRRKLRLLILLAVALSR